ncbi:TRAP transporter small permease subunit [Pikeienuella piscinae]|nr:TRAP transporter small permease subunit [Pikeienuella piscinae]
MSLNTDPIDAGAPAPLLRLFGWGMLGVVAAFLIENVLVVWFQFEGARAILSGGGLVSAAIYVVCVAAAFGFVLFGPARSLRRDAAWISAFNAYLVRSLFWAVLLVGLVDAAISLLRAENSLALFFDEETVRALGLSHFIAPNIHGPLVAAGFIIGLFTRTLGFTWLALLIVGAELLIVLSRFVFSYEQALMSDLVRYWYAALFLFASAYTLLDEGHVRVDVLYAGFSTRRKGAVNAIGAILLGMTSCWVILDIGLAGKTSIINSPVASFEVSQSGSTGMYVKYQMAAFLAIFAVTMLIQFVSQLFEAVADRRDEPGRREVAPITH